MLSWFRDYLTSFFQRVTFNGQLSKFTSVQKGVPRCSVQGPFLFNLYVSNLPNVFGELAAEIPSFADDLTVYANVNYPREAMLVVSRAVRLTGQDLERRELNINANKSCAMIVGPSSLDTAELTYTLLGCWVSLLMTN